MTDMTAVTNSGPSWKSRSGSPAVVLGTVVAAIIVNLVLYLLGRAFGGEYTFTRAGEQITVNAGAVAFLTLIPLTIGMILAAVLSRRWPGVIRIALVVGPALALVTIATFTIPADFDAVSTTFLSLMHVALVPVTIVGLRALPSRP